MAEQLNSPRNNRDKRDVEILDLGLLDSELSGSDTKNAKFKDSDIKGDTAAYVACALYKFVALSDFQALREPLVQQMRDHQVFGTLLLAQEGINGTIAGTQAAIDRVLAWLAEQPGLDGIEIKQSFHHEIPFYRAKVKLKREIVTMGVEGIDPQQSAGTYIEPEQWNALISDPDVLVVDTRNDYEVQIGSFANAVDPQTTNFRDFPAWVDKNLHPGEHKKVAMFCTGGIRCEKSTAYLKQNGFDEVYHLKGGILSYLEKVPEASSRWQGECFVFDNRVTVNHKLEKGDYDQCHACRMPVTQKDMQHENYKKGVSCHYCYGEHSVEQIRRFTDREKQMNLSKKRGEAHLGLSMKAQRSSRKQEKIELKNKQRERNKQGKGVT